MLMLSVSRPDLLQQTVESMRKYIKCNNHKMRWMLHEDFLIDAQSEECIKYAMSCEEFEIIDSHRPNIMFGKSIGYMLNKYMNADFCFFNLDDIAYIRDVDLDRLLDIFIRYENVNCVALSTYAIMGAPDRPANKTYDFDGFKLTTTAHWVFGGVMWRMDVFRKYFEATKYRAHWVFNENMKKAIGIPVKPGTTNKFEPVSPDWIHENQGTYVYGAVGDPPQVQHIGSLRPYSVVAGEGRGALREDIARWVREQRKIVKRQGQREKRNKRYR